MKKPHLAILTLCLSLCPLAGPAQAQYPELTFALAIYPFVQQHEWREYDAAGTKLLEESGPIFGLGALLTQVDRGPARFEARLEGFVGEVNYDGAKLDFTPYETKTFYVGFKAEADLAARVELSPETLIAPFAGLGSRYWVRRLDNTDERELGYDEEWLSLYATLGVEGHITLPTGLHAFGEVAFRFPFYNRESAHLSPSDDVRSRTFEPAEESSIFLEAGLMQGAYRFTAFYEQLAFGASHVDRDGFYQPKVEAGMAGVSWGVLF